MRILVLEDQQIAAMLLMAMLKKMEREAELAMDGATAWAKLEKGEYRVVVSDWIMSGIDGLELCRMIRNRGGDYVYFILVSAQRITKESRQQALEAGVDDFLMKPVDPDELSMRLHVADRIVGLDRQVRQLESIIPICSYCKKIRNDKKYWQDIESYLNHQEGMQFSHGICPDCYAKNVVPQLEKMNGKLPPLAVIKSLSPPLFPA